MCGISVRAEGNALNSRSQMDTGTILFLALSAILIGPFLKVASFPGAVITSVGVLKRACGEHVENNGQFLVHSKQGWIVEGAGDHPSPSAFPQRMLQWSCRSGGSRLCP